MKRFEWCEILDRIIRSAYADNAPVVEIAAFMRKTPDAIRNRAHRIDAQRPKKNAGKENGKTKMRHYGKCINCGETVPLKWSKDLTETERDQLAALVCPCRDKAVLTHYDGACRFCGQIQSFYLISNSTQQEKDEQATLQCNCPEAYRYARQKTQAEKAKEKINKLFGADAAENDCEPASSTPAVQLMGEAVSLISRGELRSITIDISSTVKGKISVNGKGKITVERTDTKKRKLEEE